MATRRHNGEGTEPIQREGRRGWWLKVWVADPKTGERRRVWVKGATPTEAKGAARQTRNRAEAGRMPRADKGVTVEGYATRWMTDHLPARNVTDNTRRQYRHALNNFVIPTIGSVPIAKLSPTDVERMEVALSRAGKSASSRRSAYNVLRTMCDTAVRDRVISYNAVKDAARPTDTPTSQPSYDATQIRRLLVTVEGHQTLESLVPLLLWTAMRVGEALALRWEDIDLESSTPSLWVRATNVQNDEGRIVRQPWPKGKVARQVPLLPDAVAALKGERKAQVERRLAAGALWEDHGLVFSDVMGRLVDDRPLRSHYRPLVAQAGLTGSFHALRRSTAQMLTRAKVPLNVVSAILGHSSTAVTQQRYAVVDTGMMEQALKDLASFWEGSADPAGEGLSQAQAQALMKLIKQAAGEA